MAKEDFINVTPGRRESRFSRHELTDISISMLVLTLAFVLLYRDGGIGTYPWYLEHTYGTVAKWALLFLTCLGLVVFSFLLHELGHKFTAQNMGMRSEYRMFPLGLVVTLVSSMIGFLFAAPGAVMIYGHPDKKENALISLAGPCVNIVLALVGIAGLFAFNHTPWVFVFLLMANLNAFLALFNLLPVPPLDGSKIWQWSIPLYVAAIAVAALEVAYMWFWMPNLYWA